MMSEPGASSSGLRALSLVLRGVAGLLVVGVPVAISAMLVATRPTPEQKARPERVITVRAVRVEPVPVARAWDGYGTARAMRSADVSAQVSGRVIERPEGIESGARIAAGDVIVRIDPLDFEQRAAASTQLIAAWEAQIAGLDVNQRRLADQFELGQEELRFDERELVRIKSAAELRGANEVEIERREAVLNRKRRELSALQQQVEAIGPERARIQAMIANEQATLRIARENIERATIRAPIDGYLQEVLADRGEMLAIGAIGGGAPFARIVDLSRIEVPLRLPVSAAASVGVGDAVEFRADSPGTSPEPARWTGRVVRIAPETDPGTRTLVVFAEVVQDAGPGADRARLLLPGQFVVGRVTTSRIEQRPVVPRAAVNADRVLIADPAPDGGQRARAAGVEVLYYLRASFPALDPAETEWAVLEGGVMAGETVITTNLDEVRHGVRVRVETSGAVATDGAAQPGSGAGRVGGGGP